jgi:hypothetical protein
LGAFLHDTSVFGATSESPAGLGLGVEIVAGCTGLTRFARQHGPPRPVVERVAFASPDAHSPARRGAGSVELVR